MKSSRRGPLDLSRRERQIMEIVYRMGEATAAEIRTELPDPPTDSAVRAQLKILEDKGVLTHTKDGVRYVYSPVNPRSEVRASALEKVLSVFFDGSVEEAVATMLDLRSSEISDEELRRLADLVDKARDEGR